MTQQRLPIKTMLAVTLLALIWGANMATIKIAAREMAPMYLAGLRSLIAGSCLYIWMKATGMTVFPDRVVLGHGVVLGLLFGAEFALIYTGLGYTTASRTYILVYTAPFFVALGAHFFLQGDRLHTMKVVGLLLAFVGVVTLFSRGLGQISFKSLSGDLMALCGGALWGATTVYMKKYLAHRAHPLQTLYYTLIFSTPFLFGASLLSGETWVWRVSGLTLAAVFYQSVIVAFLSYLGWYHLVHKHPASLLHAFSFLTPIFGVSISGVLMLGEPLGFRLLTALALVCLGLILVNREESPKAATGAGGKVAP